jgi:quercetin dioxygenase-like cupin family protein/copper chaperone CopZ
VSQAELIPEWQEIVRYLADGPRHQQLIETDDYKAVLVGLEAGQKIPPHPAAAATYHFLDGTGTMVVNGERLSVSPGATVVVPAGVPRSVEADTRLAFLGSHGVLGAKKTARQPFKKVGLVALLGMILMYGFMIAATFLVARSSPIAMMFSGGMDLGWGMWGFMILPFAGVLIMFAMMFVFYRLAARSSGSMSSMMGHGGLMARMMGHNHDSEQLQRKESDVTTHTYDIPSVNCGHCKMTIERKVGELAGVTSVNVDVAAKQAVIKYSPPATKSWIETVLTRIGYPPTGGR